MDGIYSKACWNPSTTISFYGITWDLLISLFITLMDIHQEIKCKLYNKVQRIVNYLKLR